MAPYFSGKRLWTTCKGLSFLKLAVRRFLIPAKAALCKKAFWILPHLSKSLYSSLCVSSMPGTWCKFVTSKCWCLVIIDSGEYGEAPNLPLALLLSPLDPDLWLLFGDPLLLFCYCCIEFLFNPIVAFYFVELGFYWFTIALFCAIISVPPLVKLLVSYMCYWCLGILCSSYWLNELKFLYSSRGFDGGAPTWRLAC